MENLPPKRDGRTANGPVAEMDLLLKQAVDANASDLHLKLGQPPIVRRDGHLEALDGWERLDSTQLGQFVEQVGASDPKRLAAFRETGELDTAYQVAGLPRF